MYQNTKIINLESRGLFWFTVWEMLAHDQLGLRQFTPSWRGHAMDPQHSLHHGPESKRGNRIPQPPTQASSMTKTAPLCPNRIILRSKFSTGGALGASFPNHRHYGFTLISFILSTFKLMYKYMLYVEHILLDTLFWYSPTRFSHSPDLPPPSPCHLWWLGELRVVTGTAPQCWRTQEKRPCTVELTLLVGTQVSLPGGLRAWESRADAAPHQPQQLGEWELYLAWVK